MEIGHLANTVDIHGTLVNREDIIRKFAVDSTPFHSTYEKILGLLEGVGAEARIEKADGSHIVFLFASISTSPSISMPQLTMLLDQEDAHDERLVNGRFELFLTEEEIQILIKILKAKIL